MSAEAHTVQNTPKPRPVLTRFLRLLLRLPLMLLRMLRRERVEYEVIEPYSSDRWATFGRDEAPTSTSQNDLGLLPDIQKRIGSVEDLIRNLKREDLVALAENWAARAREKYRAEQERIFAQIYELQIQKELDQAHTAAQEARIKFNDEVSRSRDTLYDLKTQLSEHANELKRFRQENKLQRPSARPESRWWFGGIVAALLLIESLLNGSVLAQGLETGLIGGWGLAIVISFINVIFLGLVIGAWCLRQRNHISLWHRIVGNTGLVVIFVLAIVVNSVVAHYRDESNGPDPENASVRALSSFWQHPLVLNDVTSYLLWVLGIAFWLFATVEGYKMDDPYPQYGKVSERYQNILNSFLARKETETKRLESLRDQLVERLDQRTDSIEQKRYKYHELKEALKHRREEFESAKKLIEDFVDRVSEQHHPINQPLQPGAPPDSFPQRWTVPNPDDTEAGPQIAPFPEQKVEETLNELKETRRSIFELYESARKQFESVQQLVES